MEIEMEILRYIFGRDQISLKKRQFSFGVIVDRNYR
jgi:hypothetical protein